MKRVSDGLVSLSQRHFSKATEKLTSRLAKSTHLRLHSTPEEKSANMELLTTALRTVLECIGEDPDREGLQRTPERYAKALLWMTKGYEERLVDVINDAVFAEDHDEMVIVRDIEVFSLCEHHLVPFTGKVCYYCVGFTGYANAVIDFDWLHPQQACFGPFQARSYCRNFLPSSSSSRTSHKASCSCC